MAVSHPREHDPARPRWDQSQGSAASRHGLNRPYSVGDFIDDQSRILEAVEPGAGRRRFKVDRLEGRMIVLQVPRLSADPEARGAAGTALQEKYGRQADVVMKRFMLVQDYLIDGCDRIDYAGLGKGAEKGEVCHEFLSYLLAFRLNPVRPALPEDALDRFLDEWGHRWM